MSTELYGALLLALCKSPAGPWVSGILPVQREDGLSWELRAHSSPMPLNPGSHTVDKLGPLHWSQVQVRGAYSISAVPTSVHLQGFSVVVWRHTHQADYLIRKQQSTTGSWRGRGTSHRNPGCFLGHRGGSGDFPLHCPGSALL